MPTIPVGRLTRAQIVLLATRKAGNTQLGANSATEGADAQTILNQLLYDLATQYNWPLLNVSATLTLTSATFSLPSDFLKAANDYSLQIFTIDQQAQQFFILEVDRATFDAASFASQAGPVAGIPRIWTADRSAGTGSLFPDPTGHVMSAVLRYQQAPVDIDVTTAGDATVPWFPWSMVLVQGLYAYILEFEADGRADMERAKFDKMLEGVRQA